MDAFQNKTGRSMSDVERKIFSRTFEHPVVGHLAEWTPCAALLDIANPSPDNLTNLGNWHADTIVDEDRLFEDMLAHGMRDPLIVGIGRVSRKVRLEAGNHRIRLFLKKDIRHVPAVAYVGDHAVHLMENGLHEGKTMALKILSYPDIMGPYPIKEYKRISDVLAEELT